MKIWLWLLSSGLGKMLHFLCFIRNSECRAVGNWARDHAGLEKISWLNSPLSLASLIYCLYVASPALSWSCVRTIWSNHTQYNWVWSSLATPGLEWTQKGDGAKPGKDPNTNCWRTPCDEDVMQSMQLSSCSQQPTIYWRIMRIWNSLQGPPHNVTLKWWICILSFCCKKYKHYWTNNNDVILVV